MEKNNNSNLGHNPNPRGLSNLLGGKILRENFNNKGIMKNPWEYYCGSSKNPNFNGEDSYMGHYGCNLWPPRSYICSFCKREFRSAQALGGHMNVHRRDRARLRLNESPPREINLNLSPNPNPNPNFSITPPLSRKVYNPSHTTTSTTCILPCLVSPSLSSCASTSPNFLELKKPYGAMNESLSSKGSGLVRMKALKSLFEVKELDGFTRENENEEARVWLKNGDFVGLDLGIGVHSKEDHVDLELRLGYS